MRTFTINFCGGWGARLVMLGAARIFAARHARQLRFHWDHNFVCPWDRFTATPAALISTTAWRVYREQVVPHWENMHFWRDDAGASDLPDMAVSATWVPHVLGVTAKQAIDEVKGWIDFSQVERAADAIEIPRDTVGVHIRRGDAVAAFGSADASPRELYLDAMAAVPASVPFFICTDDADERRELCKAFPTAFCSGLALGRGSPETLFNDLVEAVLLSRCQRLLLGYGSSFGRLAALYGDTPLTMLSHKPITACPWWLP